MTRPPPRPTLFPYTTLFRSVVPPSVPPTGTPVPTEPPKPYEWPKEVAGKTVKDVIKALSDPDPMVRDRKSTRLNSSHANISYAVFCLKKKKERHRTLPSLIL